MGLASGFLTLSAFNAFYVNGVNGHAWVGVALLVLASWRLAKAWLGGATVGPSGLTLSR